MAGASEHNRVIGWSWRLLQVLAFALFIRNTPPAKHCPGSCRVLRKGIQAFEPKAEAQTVLKAKDNYGCCYARGILVIGRRVQKLKSSHSRRETD